MMGVCQQGSRAELDEHGASIWRAPDVDVCMQLFWSDVRELSNSMRVITLNNFFGVSLHQGNSGQCVLESAAIRLL